MTSQRRIVCLAVVLFLFLAGCGQSGPLFLPEETEPAAQAPESAAETAAEQQGATGGKAADDQNDADDDQR